MLHRKGYIGRHLRPSQLARELLPSDQLWCSTCHLALPKKNWADHRASRNHRLASSKLQKMKQLSLDMWARHRAAPLHSESAHEENIEAEFERFRDEQRRREQLLYLSTSRK